MHLETKSTVSLEYIIKTNEEEAKLLELCIRIALERNIAYKDDREMLIKFIKQLPAYGIG